MTLCIRIKHSQEWTTSELSDDDVRWTDMKKCRLCNIEKPENGYYKRTDPKRAASDPCRDCVFTARKIDYSKRKEHMSERARRYRKEHPEKIRDTKLRQAYGVGSDYYNAKLKEQGGVCAGCRIHVKTTWKDRVVAMAMITIMKLERTVASSVFTVIGL